MVNTILAIGTIASLAGGILKTILDRRHRDSSSDEMEIRTASGVKLRVHLSPEKSREVIASAQASALR